MAIVGGSASRASRGSTMSGSSTDDNPPARPRQQRIPRSGESDGSEDESTERASEVCQIGDDMCTVPSQLFDLPSLKGVLSLNTWNYCLTEEERESLALYLPPVEDEEVFKDTIRELLGGETFHFSSPMADLFDRLKGGLCHPRVSRYREGLKYLQHKEHYHLLRQYHNHMVSLFVEMQKQWEQHSPDANVNERLEIWHRFQTQPPPLPKPKRTAAAARRPGTVRSVLKAGVDIKRRPPEGNPTKKSKMVEFPKKGKLLIKSSSNRSKAPPPPPPPLGSKGVLKMKTLLKERGAAAPSKRLVDLDRVEREEKAVGPPAASRLSSIKPAPKGVLKLVSSKGKGVLKKTAPLAEVKGKAPALVEVKREEAIDVVGEDNNGGDDKEEEPPPRVPVEEEEPPWSMPVEAVAASSPAKVVAGEGEKKPKRRPGGEGKKRKMVELGGGGGAPEAEVVVMMKKKKNRIQEPKEEAETVPAEMMIIPEPLQLPADDDVPPEEAKPLAVDKGKKVVDAKKKPHRKKKIDDISKEPTAVVPVEETRLVVEDDVWPSEDVDKKALGALVDEEQLDLVKEEVVVEVKPKKKTKKKPKAEKVPVTSPGESSPPAGSPAEKIPGSATKASKKPATLAIPTLASTFPFSVVHLLSAVRAALLNNYGDGLPEYHDPLEKAESSRERFDLELPYVMSEGINPMGQSDQSPGVMGVERTDGRDADSEHRPHSVPFGELVRRVHLNPGDPPILNTMESLQDLVRGALKIMGSKVAPAGAKGWKPLVCFDKEMKAWLWTGPLTVPPVASTSSQDTTEVQVTAEAWGIPQKTLLKLEDMFACWLKHDQETLQQIVQLPLPPPLPMPVPVDEKERFRDLRAQKSLMTIAPSSEDMRTYFRRQELLRYSLPDRAFSYTTAEGRKSAVAPLRRGGGKPTSKARDHFMLKADRPPHVTILCLVRDAAARLPGSIGTRADVCALIRDSQFIMEEVSDAQVNQVVSGALDRLHYERDPCVRFDGDRKLWVYLHTDREEEDFEDDGTSSTKRWKKPKKDSADNSEHCAAAYETGSLSGAEDLCGAGLMDLHSPDGMGGGLSGGPADHSAIYLAGRTELVYNKSSSLTSPRVLGNGHSSRNDGELPFIELPPNIDGGHPMGWEGVTTQASWEHHHSSHLQSQESLGSEDDFYIQRDADAMLNPYT